MLCHHEAPAQCLAHQAVDRDRPQVLAFEAQQGHGAAVELAAQCRDEALQPHRGRQFGHEVGQEQAIDQGIFHLARVQTT